MSAEEKQKICIECRALVPQTAENCPECGYPFDDDLTTKCRSCNSVIVPDVENCPVCGQPQAVSQPESGVEEPEQAPAPVTVMPVEVSEESVPHEVEDTRLESGFSPPPEAGVMVAAPVTQAVTAEEVQRLLDMQNRAIEGMLKQVLESNNQMLAALSGQQRESQNALQESVDAIKAVVASAVPRESKETELLEMLTDLKVAIADVATQNAASATMIVGAVNSSASKAVEQPVVELPGSFKWLDYMFIAIIVALIFSMGNLLIMAYVARLIINSIE